mgnify:FL=1
MAPAMAAIIIFLHVISCVFYPLVAHAGQTEEEDTKQFGVKKGREQSCGTLEIGQYPVHNIKRPAHFV